MGLLLWRWENYEIIHHPESNRLLNTKNVHHLSFDSLVHVTLLYFTRNHAITQSRNHAYSLHITPYLHHLQSQVKSQDHCTCTPLLVVQIDLSGHCCTRGMNFPFKFNIFGVSKPRGKEAMSSCTALPLLLSLLLSLSLERRSKE